MLRLGALHALTPVGTCLYNSSPEGPKYNLHFSPCERCQTV